ncbi:MAG: DUF4271 domain-containing protein [Pedobacter sp.]|nr:MAG: DUF4271 domain-containing protein [Pedobacter sp.]
MRLKLFLFLVCCGFCVYAQQVKVDSVINPSVMMVDSTDTVAVYGFRRDTVAPVLFRALDSLQKVEYADSVKKTFGYPFFDLSDVVKHYRRSDQMPEFQQGKPIYREEIWIIACIAFLLILFAILKNAFDKQLAVIVQSFFSNRILGNINKEDNLFSSWPFILLFLHFGFTIGLFLYLVVSRQGIEFSENGFNLFVTISVGFIILYLLKIFVLRLLGFFFDIEKPVNEYVSILVLTYFNVALLFIPFLIAVALSPPQYGEFYMVVGILLFAIVFAFQLIRAGVTVLSQNRFSKVYLFLYFCTLEICPILILIKAIGF